VRRIEKKASRSNIAHSSNVKEVGSSQIENSVVIDVRLSTRCNFRDAENQGLFLLFCLILLLK
jgi:hypothetical protein